MELVLAKKKAYGTLLLKLRMQSYEMDFSLGCSGLSSVPGLTTFWAGFKKWGKLVKEWWQPPTFLWINMNEPFERFLVAITQLILNIQKVQFYLVIIHLLLSFSFGDLLGQYLSNISMSSSNGFYFTSQQMNMFDEKRINKK